MALEIPSARLRHRKLTTPRGDAEVWLERNGVNVALHQVRTNGGGTSNWKRCSEEGCLGEVVQGNRCFAHSEDHDRAAYVAKQTSAQGWVSLRGVVADEAVLKAAFGGVRQRDTLVPQLISLAGAEIVSALHFENVEFRRGLDFHGAAFTAPFAFRNCRFGGSVNGSFAHFNSGPPSWSSCDFSTDVNLDYAHAQKVSIGLEQCTVDGNFSANGVDGALLLRQSTFRGNVSIAGASTNLVSMDGASLAGSLDLADSVLQGWHAQGARIASAHQIGPFSAKHTYLQRAALESRVRIELDCDELNLDGVQFKAGGTVLLRGGRVSLQQVSVGRHLRIAGRADADAQPEILSLRDADAGSMTVANVSMEHCRFYGAHNLSAMTLESSVKLNRSPTALHVQRRCVADEVSWRASRSGVGGFFWKRRLPEPPDEARRRPARGEPEATPVAPAQIAAVYRELRRSLEARSDQPGAADFYYGEMEMRRLDRKSTFSDRSIVAAYWFVSGYGLHALRSLGMLALLLALASVALHQGGFEQQSASWSTSILFALRSMLPGMRRTGPSLTVLGESIEISLALLGPVLLGLLLLALRGRVKR